MLGKTTVTDDHLKKYQEIMDTTVTPKSTPPQKEASEAHKPENKWTKSSLLSAIPKPSSLTNKMFIFTGKKKIIIEGNEKEVEKVKTVNTGDIKKEIKDENEKEAIDKKVPEPNKSPIEIITKGKEKDKEAGKEKTQDTKKTPTQRKIPLPVLVGSFVIFLAAWTLFWLVVFGYISI